MVVIWLLCESFPRSNKLAPPARHLPASVPGIPAMSQFSLRNSAGLIQLIRVLDLQRALVELLSLPPRRVSSCSSDTIASALFEATCVHHPGANHRNLFAFCCSTDSRAYSLPKRRRLWRLDRYEIQLLFSPNNVICWASPRVELDSEMISR